MAKNPHAVALGRKGGQATSSRKTEAARANGKKGGRPKLRKALAALALLIFVTGCGQPFAPTGAGDAFTYPDILRPAMNALDQDPWIHPLLGEPAGAYVRHNTAGIVMDASMPANIGATFDRDTHLIHWQPRNTPDTMSVQLLASTILHEARHGAGIRHSCDNGHDRTFEEGGAFAVQILYLNQQQVSADWLRPFIGC